MKTAKTSESIVPARRPGQDVTNTRKTVSHSNNPVNPANNMAKAQKPEGGVPVGVVKKVDPNNTKAAQTATRPGGVAARPTTARPATAAAVPAAPVKAGGARQPARPKSATQTTAAPKRNAAAVTKKVVAKKQTSIYEDIKKKPSPKQDAALEAALEAALAEEEEEKKKKAAAKIAAATRPAGPRRMIKKTDPVFSEAYSDIIANAFDSSSSLEEDDGNETETGLPSSDDTVRAVQPSSPSTEDKENSAPAAQQIKRRSPESHPFTSDDETELLSTMSHMDELQPSSLLPITTAEDLAILDEAHATYLHEIDPDELDDIRMVGEYTHEIFAYLARLELELAPNPNYMEHQPELQWSMRAILLDWLVQVHQRLELRPETMFLTVNIIDRFLTVQVVTLRKIQLVGITALFIASKYEEVAVPALSEMTYMVDNGYLPEEILNAERYMLTKLNFSLGWPGPMSFLRKISKADDYDVDTRTLAKYFCEVAFMDSRFVGVPPSLIAAGAEGLARIMLEKGPWVSLSLFALLFRVFVAY